MFVVLSGHATLAHAPSIVKPFSGVDATQRLPPGPPNTDFFYVQCLRRSPDGRFVARLAVGGGEVAYLTVYHARMPRRRYQGRYAVSQEFADVHGCLWVPGHGHWLAVSAGGADYGLGLLALWTGKRHTHFLRRAKNPVGEGWDISGATADGRALVYEHLADGASGPFRVALPRR